VHDWTPAEIRDALDTRDPVQLRLLFTDLSRFAEIGRNVVHRRLGQTLARRTVEDDIQDVLFYFIKDGARILRKYGAQGEYHLHPGGLRRYATGVSVLFLRQRHTRDRSRYERLVEDFAVFPTEGAQIRRVEQEMDLERVLIQLGVEERHLFEMIYDEQLEKPVICERLGLTVNGFEQRKSRLLTKMARLLDRGAQVEREDRYA
jgi:hypothetical protein